MQKHFIMAVCLILMVKESVENYHEKVNYDRFEIINIIIRPKINKQIWFDEIKNTWDLICICIHTLHPNTYEYLYLICGLLMWEFLFAVTSLFILL